MTDTTDQNEQNAVCRAVSKRGHIMESLAHAHNIQMFGESHAQAVRDTLTIGQGSWDSRTVVDKDGVRTKGIQWKIIPPHTVAGKGLRTKSGKWRLEIGQNELMNVKLASVGLRAGLLKFKAGIEKDAFEILKGLMLEHDMQPDPEAGESAIKNLTRLVMTESGTATNSVIVKTVMDELGVTEWPMEGLGVKEKADQRYWNTFIFQCCVIPGKKYDGITCRQSYKSEAAMFADLHLRHKGELVLCPVHGLPMTRKMDNAELAKLGAEIMAKEAMKAEKHEGSTDAADSHEEEAA